MLDHVHVPVALGQVGDQGMGVAAGDAEEAALAGVLHLTLPAGVDRLLQDGVGVSRPAGPRQPANLGAGTVGTDRDGDGHATDCGTVGSGEAEPHRVLTSLDRPSDPSVFEVLQPRHLGARAQRGPGRLWCLADQMLEPVEVDDELSSAGKNIRQRSDGTRTLHSSAVAWGCCRWSAKY